MYSDAHFILYDTWGYPSLPLRVSRGIRNLWNRAKRRERPGPRPGNWRVDGDYLRKCRIYGSFPTDLGDTAAEILRSRDATTPRG